MSETNQHEGQVDNVPPAAQTNPLDEEGEIDLENLNKTTSGSRTVSMESRLLSPTEADERYVLSSSGGQPSAAAVSRPSSAAVAISAAGEQPAKDVQSQSSSAAVPQDSSADPAAPTAAPLPSSDSPVSKTATEPKKEAATEEGPTERRKNDTETDPAPPLKGSAHVHGSVVSTDSAAAVEPSRRSSRRNSNRSQFDKTDPSIQATAGGTTTATSSAVGAVRIRHRPAGNLLGVGAAPSLRIAMTSAAERLTVLADDVDVQQDPGALLLTPCRTSTALLGRQVLAPLLLEPTGAAPSTDLSQQPHHRGDRGGVGVTRTDHNAGGGRVRFFSTGGDGSLTTSPVPNGAAALMTTTQDGSGLHHHQYLDQSGADASVDRVRQYVVERSLMKSRAHLPPIARTIRILAHGIDQRLKQQHRHVEPGSVETSAVSDHQSPSQQATDKHEPIELEEGQAADTTAVHSPNPTATCTLANDVVATADASIHEERRKRSERHANREKKQVTSCKRLLNAGPSLMDVLLKVPPTSWTPPPQQTAEDTHRNSLVGGKVERDPSAAPDDAPHLARTATRPPRDLHTQPPLADSERRRHKKKSHSVTPVPGEALKLPTLRDVVKSVPSELLRRMPRLLDMASQTLGDPDADRKMRQFRRETQDRFRRREDAIDKLVERTRIAEMLQGQLAAEREERKVRIAEAVKLGLQIPGKQRAAAAAAM